MQYAIFSESIHDHLNHAKNEYEIIKKELAKSNLDFSQKDKQLFIKCQEIKSELYEDWIIERAESIAKKYGLKYLEVSKKTSEEKTYYDLSLLLVFDNHNEIEIIKSTLGEYDDWNFLRKFNESFKEPTTKIAALKNVLEKSLEEKNTPIEKIFQVNNR